MTRVKRRSDSKINPELYLTATRLTYAATFTVMIIANRKSIRDEISDTVKQHIKKKGLQRRSATRPLLLHDWFFCCPPTPSSIRDKPRSAAYISDFSVVRQLPAPSGATSVLPFTFRIQVPAALMGYRPPTIIQYSTKENKRQR